MTNSILKPNINSSQFIKLKRLGILIDSDEYYQAFFNVTNRAKTSINIHGWEFDSRINLSHVNSNFPDGLREYFTILAKKNRNLLINIRSWKSSFYLRFGRERFANFKWKLQVPQNIDYRQIRHYALYGSLHEKIAIIDNSCAFIGGMDITKKRWDTQEHIQNDSRRLDPEGKIYFPIHDIQAVCSHEIAHELNHKILNHPTDGQSNIWPDTFFSQIENLTVALSRTDPEKKLTQIEKLYLDAIRSSKKLIYIENQYLSNEVIFDLLVEKLKEIDGPEVIIITPMSYRGFFEKAIYQYSRDKILKKLKEADQHHRLGIFYPSSSNNPNDGFIVVHSKIMIIDDRFMTIGSANLNYRSMRLDRELNISFETMENDKIKTFITNIFYRLIAEHLGTTPEHILKLNSVSPLSLVNMLKGSGVRTLKDLESLKNPRDHFPMILLTPFIDMKFALPKKYLYTLGLIIVCVFFILGNE